MQEIGLILLLVTLPLLFFFMVRARAGKAQMRPLAGMAELQKSAAISAETGQPIHVSVGVAGVGGAYTAETWAGLTLLNQMADEAAARGTPLIVTVADATVLPIAQDILRRAYVRHGNAEGYDPTQVRFIAPLPAAYAAGVMGLFAQQPLSANVMAGSFGEEYLLIGETGARRGIHQIVGSADPQTLPLVYVSANDTLIGEEMFAAGAYTARLPIQVGSLQAEDWARWAVIAAIIVTALVKIFA